jgi:hypothetical protein
LCERPVCAPAATALFCIADLLPHGEIAMKRHVVIAAVFLAVVLVGLGPASRRAQADNKIPDLTAFPDYSGPFTSSVSGMGGFVSFEITRQEGRHFWGVVTFEIGGMAMPGFEFDGTVAATGKFKGKGEGPAGDVAFDGTVVPLGDDFFEIMANYIFISAEGGMDAGTASVTNESTGD